MRSKKKKSSGGGSTSQAAADLFSGIRRGGGGQQSSGVERFPTPEEIANDPALRFDIENKAGRVFAGLVGGTMQEHIDPLTEQTMRYATGGTLIGFADDRHASIIGPARSGKGRSHFLPILYTYPVDASIVIIDIKGDLASATATYRASKQRTWLLDPFRAASSETDPYREGCGFNPLARVDPDDADAVVERAILTATSLVTRSQGEDPHWNDTAEQAIAGTCAHVMTSPLHAEQRHLGTVFRLLTDKTVRPDPHTPCDLEAEMRTNPAAGGMVISTAAAFFGKSDREFASTCSTIQRHLNWLHFPEMRRVVETDTVDLGSIQTTPTALFLSMPVRHMSSCAGFLRMVLNCLLASFESGDARRKHQMRSGGHRTLIIIDEMPALGYVRELEIAAGQIAGLGAKLYFCCQDLNQLKAAYPKSYETFLANSGTCTFLAPQDTTTLEWIQKRLGETTIVQHSRSEGSIQSLIKDGSSGRSSSLQTHPLMTTAEAARILKREDPFARQLVISASHGPMLLQRANYDQHPAFAPLLAKPKGAQP